jgi:hypothetical protein
MKIRTAIIILAGSALLTGCTTTPELPEEKCRPEFIRDHSRDFTPERWAYLQEQGWDNQKFYEHCLETER